jgi:indole-3-glycerol phosphate synthase
MILDRIVQTKREEVEHLAGKREIREWRRLVSSLPPARPFAASLRGPGGPRLIAEVKKASPSKGVIRADFDPVAIASAYAEGGAHAISVLTDGPFFQGKPDDLTAVRGAVRLPVLRKDFIIDERQVYESRWMGADAILLIVAILSRDELDHLLRLSRELSMDALVEVHHEQELDTALSVGADLIGINNRDLRDFSVSLETTVRLVKQIPAGITVVSESGIATFRDVEWVHRAGADAILVGESLMRAENLVQAVRSLLGRAG